MRCPPKCTPPAMRVCVQQEKGASKNFDRQVVQRCMNKQW